MSDLSKFLVENILLGEASSVKDLVVVYSGRFQPFHKGHFATYQTLVKKFGKNNVYIGTSDKTDNQKSPFNFKEKVKVMTTMFGIPSNKIVQVKNPYAPSEILNKFNKETTAFITVVGEKDSNRLGGKYFEKYKDSTELEGYVDRGYVFISPAQPNAISGTDVRVGLRKGSTDDKKDFFVKKAYGKFNQSIFDMVVDKLSKLPEITENNIYIPTEIIESWLVDNLDLVVEATMTMGRNTVDDGPNFVFPSYSSFDKISKKRAERIGYTVLSQIMSDELTDIDPHPIYPKGPVKAVTPFPAGVIGKTTATNQKDYYGSVAYNKWLKHISRIAGMVGYSLVDSLDLLDDKEESLKTKKIPGLKLPKIVEAITLDVEIGDTVLMGKFKNKKVVVKTIGKDEHGMPTINGKKVATFRMIKENSLTESEIVRLNNTLGIEREELPQIDNDSMDEYLKHLESSNIAFETKSQPVASLNTSQTKIDLDKIKNIMNNDSKMNPIIVSKDDYILDGHHRALAAYNTDNECEVPIIKVDLPIDELIEISNEFNGAYNQSISEDTLNEIPMGDLRQIDTFADKQLNPMDIVLTGKHFFDRLNDPRNGKEISNAELIGFFKRLGKKKKEFIEFLNQYDQIVAKDNRTNINIPFMKQANKAIAKTIMRKDNFKTTNLDYKFESILNEQLDSNLEKKYGVTLDIYEYPEYLELHRIVVPKEKRSEGIGTKVMNDIITYAKKNKKDIFLTPSSDFGGSKGRLIQFYKSFGFKDNKGGNRDFRSKESMKLTVETIKHIDGKWVVYPSKGGDRLGTHDTKEKALKQLKAIEISKNENVTEAYTKGNIFGGKIKIGGVSVPLEVELIGADNKKKVFITKVVHIDSKYHSKLPSNGLLEIPARIFRTPGGGWYKIKTKSAFEGIGMGYPDQAWIDKHDEILKKLRKKFDAEKQQYNEPYALGGGISERIEGGKVICEVCEWSWKISEGGSDTYICHKCGCDNNPKLTEVKTEVQIKKINISFELFDGTKISEDITLAMSPNSQGVFELGDNVAKYTGLSLKDAQEYNETPDDAYAYGLVNTMNDGQDIYFWTNGRRLAGKAKKVGAQTAVIEQLAHEGLHLTRAILAKSLMGDKFPTGEWPSIGEQGNDTIEEEQLTTALSFVIEHITPSFIEMAKKYISKPKDKSLAENILTEGGAYGHMNHPFDTSINLTFGQLKNIVNLALEGKLELTREKTDGQALAISWVNGRLVAARNKGHLANRGENALDINGVATKFAGRGELEKAYNFAMNDLSKAIKALSEKQREKIFKNGACFMNLEVIYPTSVNVIPYGQALLVFHGTMEYNEAGVAIGQNQEAAKVLAGMIKQVNQNVQSAYTIQGPPVVKLPQSKNLTALKGKYNGQITKLQSKFKLSDTDGIADYHQAWWTDFVTKKSPSPLDNKTLMGLVKRWAFYDKSFRLDNKNISEPKVLDWAKGIDKNDHDKIAKDNIRPFEDIFLGVGSEVLSFMSSVLTVNPDSAVRAMKDRLDKTISDVKAGGDEKKIEKLKMELQRLNAIGGKNKIVPNEGIVFVYNGNTMKLTGTFAPLNQILGLFYE
jgi:GNAT superfamily N-acetyltransferase